MSGFSMSEELAMKNGIDPQTGMPSDFEELVNKDSLKNPSNRFGEVSSTKDGIKIGVIKTLDKKIN